MEISVQDYRQYVLQNATVTSSGSAVFTDFGAKEISLIINVTGSVTGTSPTLTFTIQEVDAGDNATSLGSSQTGAAIIASGTQILTIPLMVSGSVKISWTIGGSASPTFNGVYATIVSKLAGTHAIFDNAGHGPVAVKPANTAAVAADPALVVSISPNTAVTVSSAVTRTTGVFLGTDETTGITIATTATSTSSEIDMFGNNSSEGWLVLYLKFTSTVTAGTMDVTLYSGRVTGQDYADQAPLVASYAPINGTQKIMLGMFRATRFMVAAVKNNATGANATNVTLGYELYTEN